MNKATPIATQGTICPMRHTSFKAVTFDVGTANQVGQQLLYVQVIRMYLYDEYLQLRYSIGRESEKPSILYDMLALLLNGPIRYANQTESGYNAWYNIWRGHSLPIAIGKMKTLLKHDSIISNMQSTYTSQSQFAACFSCV